MTTLRAAGVEIRLAITNQPHASFTHITLDSHTRTGVDLCGAFRPASYLWLGFAQNAAPKRQQGKGSPTSPERAAQQQGSNGNPGSTYGTMPSQRPGHLFPTGRRPHPHLPLPDCRRGGLPVRALASAGRGPGPAHPPDFQVWSSRGPAACGSSPFLSSSAAAAAAAVGGPGG